MKYLIYKENRTHGTFNFPFEFYDVTPSHPRYNMMYHWHDEYEMIYITSGNLVLNIDGEKFNACKGDIIFLKGGTLHGGIPNNCTYECIVFDMKFLLKETHICSSEIYKILNGTKNVQLCFSEKNPEAYSILLKIFKEMRHKKKGYYLKVEGALYYFIGIVEEKDYYSDDSLINVKHNRGLNQFKEVLLYIENNYNNPITLEDLSECINMNSRYFCKFFKQMTDKTPIEYLNYYRIECACAQFFVTDKTVTEIAFDCGFNDLSYFIRVFKKFKGTTPYKYMKSI